MLRSMFSGVSGLRSHQTMMDVIGNNIANVNTVGYKSSSTVFQDLLSQAIQGAGAPSGFATGNGGTNPAQVGLGVRIAGVTTNYTQGAAQLTGRSTDLSISGDGFFVVRDGAQQLYTRAGSLSFDGLGRLTTSDGAVLQGWTADAAGNVNANAAVTDINMPLGQALNPAKTTKMKLGGNLPSDAPVSATGAIPGSKVVSSMTVYDTQGTAIDVTFEFIHTAANTWNVKATAPNENPAVTTPVVVGTATDLVWDPAATPPKFTAGLDFDLDNLAAAGSFTAADRIAVDFGLSGDTDALSMYAGESSLAALSQDGSSLGSLQSFAIGQDGIVTGVFSNGKTRAIAQIALAGFANPVGLEKVGASLYRQTINSGLANVGTAGGAGRGTLSGSTLEMSNVDLAQEFTNLIIAQRGFQANSRVISASDELLQDLVNLKR